jgi:hypothetical protein
MFSVPRGSLKTLGAPPSLSLLSHHGPSWHTIVFSKEEKKWFELVKEISRALFHMIVPFLNLS